MPKSPDQIRAEAGFYAQAQRPTEAVREARLWLLDCFSDSKCVEDINTATPLRLMQGVERHYQGGWKAFLLADDNLALTVEAGDRFDTMYEAGCVALTDPDEHGSFEGLDSDGVRCSYSVAMLIAVHHPRSN